MYSYSLFLLSDDHWTFEENLAEFKKISEYEMQNYIKRFTSRLFIECFYYGNIKKQVILSGFSTFIQILCCLYS